MDAKKFVGELEEFIKAVITDDNSDRIEDAIRLFELRDDFIETVEKELNNVQL